MVYNGQDTLEATIKSIEKQSYKNIEYIVIDGGSKDLTLSLIQQYKHVITHWISEPDQAFTMP